MTILRPLLALGFGASFAATGCIFDGSDDDDEDGNDCVVACEDTHEKCAVDCDDDACVAVCDKDLETCKADCD